MRLFIFFILLFNTIGVFGQVNSNVPIGTWRTHLPTTSIATVSILSNKIYAASTKSSFTYDISDNHVASLSKIDGLTQSDIEVIRFNESTKVGIIGYSNGNIDIIRNGQLQNFDVIFRSTVAGSKKINNITLYNNFAFISCDYGVSVLDLKKNEVIESWLSLRTLGLPNSVYGATLNGTKDSVFLATEYGLMSAPYGKPGINLMDFTNWKVYTNIPITGVNSVGELDGKIYAGIKQTGVFVLTGTTWQNIGLTIDAACWNLVKSNNKLLVSAGTKVFSIQNPTTFSAITIPADLLNIHDALYDKAGNIWVADLKVGLVKLTGTNSKIVSLNGPYSSETFNLYYYNNTILANSGGYSNIYAPTFNGDGFYEFENQQEWKSYLWYTSNLPQQFFDNVTACYNSFDNTLYMGSFGDGMVGFKKPNTFELMDVSNSPLKSDYVTGLDVDSEGTLWIVTHSSPTFQPSIYAKNKTGVWTPYMLSTSRSENRNLLQIKIDSVGNKWMRYGANGMGRGVIVFNSQTFQERYFTTGPTGGNLPSDRVNCIEIDKKGVVWIGSDQGISAFYEPLAAFSGSFVAPIYNGFGVLFDKKINCIKTDGGNRKWVGTTEGLWLFNDNFSESIHFFTTENSPLYSNNITSIDIHDLTGEVFIATNQGILSYRSDATADNADFSTAKIFPNPVRPDYTGLVAIEGLQDNVMVKITDMQGKLFYETRSNGGTATWHLKNYAGVKAETGMYLVFATTEKGEEKFVGKIAIVQ